MLAGTAVAKLSTGGSLELRQATALVMAVEPSLSSGDLLVEPALVHRSITISTGVAQVVVHGPARLVQALSLTAASYRGGLDLLTAGARPMTVLGLRQATIAVRGVLPDGPVPITYRATNEWDRRYLGQAMTWDGELDAMSQGFTTNVAPGWTMDATRLRELYPALGAQGGLDGLVRRESSTGLTPGEVLVGAGISLRGTHGRFAQRWEGVFGFRNAGAHWGLVALDQGVADGAALTTSIEDAIGRMQYSFAAEAAGATSPLPGPLAALVPVPAPPSSSGSARLSTPPRPSLSGSAPAVSGSPPDGSVPAPPPAPLPSPTPTIPPVNTGTPVDPIVNPLINTVNQHLR
jgi:hypothetical protein